MIRARASFILRRSRARNHVTQIFTIIGGLFDDAPVGFTCQAFSSLSVAPPLVSFNVMNSSTSYPKIRESGKFSVNVLAHDQHTVSNQHGGEPLLDFKGQYRRLQEIEARRAGLSRER